MSPDPLHVTAYKAPKKALMAVINQGVTKGNLPWWHLVTQGVHAGILLGLACGLTIVVAGALDVTITGTSGTDKMNLTVSAPVGLKKLVAAAVFPLGLMVIVFCGAELFTGNVMYMASAKMGNKSTWLGFARNWILTYFGNLAGSLLVAYFLFNLTELFEAPNYQKYMHSYVVTKCQTYTWGQIFLKAVGANYLVCLALWCSNASEDISAKILSIWWPLFGFVALGKRVICYFFDYVSYSFFLFFSFLFVSRSHSRL
jgi:formate/nitrite transporter